MQDDLSQPFSLQATIVKDLGSWLLHGVKRLVFGDREPLERAERQARQTPGARRSWC